MAIHSISEVAFGEDLPAFTPDTSLAFTRRFTGLIGWDAPRFNDHEAARREGFAGAMVPGVLSQGYLVAMIHNWAPVAEVVTVDTVFRAAVIADEAHTITGVVTDIDEQAGTVEIDLTVVNEKGETRVFGTAKVRLPG